MNRRIDLKALPLPELERELVGEMGEKPFRARQIYAWLHRRGATSFDEMTDLSQALRSRLAERYDLTALSTGEARVSQDGTVKFRFVTEDDRSIESVYIPEWHGRAGDDVAPGEKPDRRTLCVSTQVGCAMGCGFCMTGTMGLLRNLGAGEIVDQVHRAMAWLKGSGADEERPLSNIVFMGMGEPLHNYWNVRRAIRILLSEEGPNFSSRHVTVSTSGVVSMMDRLGQETDVKLAVSLTGTTDEVRSRLMPVNRKWPIAELLDACRRFPMRHGRRITFEYVLLAGVTDGLDDADRLAHLVGGMDAKVNLIPFNEGRPTDALAHGRTNPFDLGYRRPDDAVVTAFRDRLASHGLTVVVRRSRGRDVAAACGQLAVEGQVRARPVYDEADAARGHAPAT